MQIVNWLRTGFREEAGAQTREGSRRFQERLGRLRSVILLLAVWFVPFVIITDLLPVALGVHMEWLSRTMEAVSVVLLLMATFYFMRQVSAISGVAKPVMIGASFAAFAQALQIASRFEVVRAWTAEPLFGQIYESAFALLNGIGLILFFAGLFLALVELLSQHHRTEFERERLADEIRERRRTEVELSVKEEFLRTIQDATLDALQVIGRDGRVMWRNRTAREWFGNELDAEQAAAPEIPYEAVFSDGVTREYETPYVLRGGSESILWGRVTLIPGEPGGPARVLDTCRNVTEQRAAHAALLESEERLRAQYKNIPVPTITWRKTAEDDFVLDGYNFAAMEFTNGAVTGWMGLRATQLFAGRADIVRELDECLKSGTRRTIQTEYQMFSTGEVLSLVVTSVCVRPDSVMVHMEDVTARSRMEQEHIAYQRELDSILRTVPDVIYRLDADGCVTFVSEAVRRYGYDPANLRGNDLVQIVHPEDRDRMAACIRERRTGLRRSASVEFRLRPATEDQALIAERVFVLDAEGLYAGEEPRRDGFLGTQGTIHEVTDRTRALDVLRKSEERFRDIAMSSADWLWEVDRDGRYTYCSGRVKDLLGYEVDEVLGRTPFDLMPADEVGRVRQIFEETAVQHVPFTDLENRNLAKDGHEVTLLSSGVPMLDGQGRFLGYRGADKDITESRRAEQERLRLVKAMEEGHKLEAIGTLAGGIAHDINNTLTLILGHCALALERLDEDHPVRENVLGIRKAGSRASDVMAQILTFSRREEPMRRPVNMALIVREALKLIRASVPASIELKRDIARDGGLVFADPTQMHRVVMNLCTNAIHALPGGEGGIEVSLNRVDLDSSWTSDVGMLNPGPHVRLAVRDTGQGMAPEVVQRIFEPFFTTKQQGEGTGLGLSLVHGIVTGCGGGIRVTSEPGHGSLFEVFLPRMESAIVEETDESAVSPHGTERILVVDDDREVAQVIARMLRDLHYRVDTFTDSRAALDVLSEEIDTYDLLITDNTMPHMDGLQLAVKLKGMRRDLPILIITGYTDESLPEQVRALDVGEFMMKPIIKETLGRTVRRMLDNGVTE